jgi:hypothetical protein
MHIAALGVTVAKASDLCGASEPLVLTIFTVVDLPVAARRPMCQPRATLGATPG